MLNKIIKTFGSVLTITIVLLGFSVFFVQLIDADSDFGSFPVVIDASDYVVGTSIYNTVLGSGSGYLVFDSGSGVNAFRLNPGSYSYRSFNKGFDESTTILDIDNFSFTINSNAFDKFDSSSFNDVHFGLLKVDDSAYDPSTYAFNLEIDDGWDYFRITTDYDDTSRHTPTADLDSADLVADTFYTFRYEFEHNEVSGLSVATLYIDDVEYSSFTFNNSDSSGDPGTVWGYGFWTNEHNDSDRFLLKDFSINVGEEPLSPPDVDTPVPTYELWSSEESLQVNNSYFLPQSPADEGINFYYEYNLLHYPYGQFAHSEWFDWGTTAQSLEEFDEVRLKFYDPVEDQLITFVSDTPYDDFGYIDSYDVWIPDWFGVTYAQMSIANFQVGTTYKYWFEIDTTRSNVDKGLLDQEITEYTGTKNFIYQGSTDALHQDQFDRESDRADEWSTSYDYQQKDLDPSSSIFMEFINDYFSNVKNVFPLSWIYGATKDGTYHAGILEIVEDAQTSSTLSYQEGEVDPMSIPLQMKDQEFDLLNFAFWTENETMDPVFVTIRNILFMIIWFGFGLYVYKRGLTVVRHLGTMES